MIRPPYLYLFLSTNFLGPSIAFFFYLDSSSHVFLEFFLLVLFAPFLVFALQGVNPNLVRIEINMQTQGGQTNLLVVLLKSSQVLTGLRELALLHSLSDIPEAKISLVNSFSP